MVAKCSATNVVPELKSINFAKMFLNNVRLMDG